MLEVGDRFFAECEGGGPSTSRLETFPPRVEIAEPGGTYVLADDGPRPGWRYVWIPDRRCTATRATTLAATGAGDG